MIPAATVAAELPDLDQSVDWRFVDAPCLHCGCHLVTADDTTAECPHPGCEGYRQPVKLEKAA